MVASRSRTTMPICSVSVNAGSRGAGSVPLCLFILGAAVARAFARDGARVFLVGRTESKLDEVAAAIRSAGGVAERAEVDAMDQAAVEAHASEVVAVAGRLDISFNAISYPVVHGPLL